MKKKNIIFLCLFAVILALLYMASSTDLIIKEKKSPVYEMSVLYNTYDESFAENFRKGVNSAAKYMNVDINFVLLGENEQDNLILAQKELSGQIQAVIINQENAQQMNKILELIPANIYACVYGTQISSSKVDFSVTKDFSDMGTVLADRIIADNKGEKVVIADLDNSRTDISLIRQAIYNELLDYGIETNIIKVQNVEEGVTLLMGLASQKNNMLVALQGNLLEFVANKAYAQKVKLPIYGIGWSNQIWQSIENGTVTATIASDDYSAGYISVRELVGFVNNKSSNDVTKKVKYEVVSKENLYDENISAMLFPIE